MLEYSGSQMQGRSSSLVHNRTFRSLMNTGFGGVIASILIGLFGLGEPSALFWALAAIGLVVWSFWAYIRPVQAFATLLFVWITVYDRSTIPMFHIEGPGNRGGVALGDVLWLGFACAVLLRTFSKGIRLPERPSVSVYTLLIAPYILLSCLLPILGVFLGKWPLSYGLPGIRHLQWASFGTFAYWAARQFGASTIIAALLSSVFIATVVHMIHSGLQLFAAMKVVPWSFLYLDQLFAHRFTKTWFFYPRATGLLINPNSYGLLGALIFAIWVASTLSALRLGKSRKLLLIVGAITAVLFSGSRTAVLAVVGAFSITYMAVAAAASVGRGGSLLRGAFQFGFIFTLSAAPLLMLGFGILPEVLKKRLLLVGEILSNGAEVDPNAVGRLEMWSEALEEYWFHYPIGTWVPPSYALWSAIDSYYVATITQGTPMYLITYVLFLFGAMLLGLSLVCRPSIECKWVGLSLLGFSGVVASASLTLSPLLQPQVIAVFWPIVGLSLAMVKE